MLANLGGRLAYGTDAILIGLLFDPLGVAHFGIAATVVTVLPVVIGGFTGTLMPMVREDVARGESEAATRRYLAGTRLSIYMGLPLTVALLFEGPGVLTLWLGPEVGIPSGQLAQVLALAYVFVVANGAAPMVGLGIGMLRSAALLSVAEGLVNLGLSIALAGLLGLPGVAFGTVIACAVFHGLIWPFLLRRRLGIPLREYVQTAFRPHLAPLVAGLGALALTQVILSGDAAGPTLARAASMPGAYWITGFWSCFSSSERLSMRKQGRAVVQRVIGKKVR